jgi:hypothetical protein
MEADSYSGKSLGYRRNAEIFEIRNFGGSTTITPYDKMTFSSDPVLQPILNWRRAGIEKEGGDGINLLHRERNSAVWQMRRVQLTRRCHHPIISGSRR